jgi:hypothetical protein
MPNESPRNDPQNVWQNQPTEEFNVSADLLRDKANRLYAKGRFMALFGLCTGLICGALFAVVALGAHDALARGGWGLISVWAFYLAYQSYHRDRPSELEAGAPAGASLEFYRTELEKRRDLLRHFWRRSGLALCFLGLALVVGPALVLAFKTPRLLVNAIPFFVLLIGWGVAVLVMNRQERANLDRDIEELRAYERRSS